MSGTLQRLLSLPVCLRQQIVFDSGRSRKAMADAMRISSIAKRAFTGNPSLFIKSTGKPQVVPSRSPPTPRPAPAAAAKSKTTTTSTPSPPPSQTTKSYAEQLFAMGDEILLYKAPRHRSFYFHSFILGSAFILGAYGSATLAFKPDPNSGRRLSWITASAEGFVMIVMALIGTNFLLAPSRLIKSITVLNPAITRTKRPVLRFEFKRVLPLFKRKVIEVAPTVVFVDRQITAHGTGYLAVPLMRSPAFTADQAPLAPRIPQVSGMWNTFTRDVRRMFFRQGFAYIRLEGGGNWKLDLQGCQILDDGKPLIGLMMLDELRGVGVVAALKRYLVTR